MSWTLIFGFELRPPTEDDSCIFLFSSCSAHAPMLQICLLILVIHVLFVGFQIGLLIKLFIQHNTTQHNLIHPSHHIVHNSYCIGHFGNFFTYITSNETFYL